MVPKSYSGEATKAFFTTSAAPLGAPQTFDVTIYDQPARQPLPTKKAVKKQREVSETAFAPSARAKAMLRGVEIAEADLRDSGGAFELEEVQKLLRGVSRQSVEKKVREGALLAVPGPSNRRRYPTMQFNDGTLLPGLKEVQAALPTRNGWSVLNFLIHPNSLLDQRRPIDLIKAGEVELGRQGCSADGRDGRLSAPSPPPDIASRSPTILALGAETRIERIFTVAYEPIYFDKTLSSRLNAPDGSFARALCGETLRGAFAETFLREPGRTLIAADEISRKARAQLAIMRQVNLVAMMGAGLAQLGATAEVTHGGLPYDTPQQWAAALYAHPGPL